MKQLNIRVLKADELKDGANLLGRAMSDNPNNVQAFGLATAHRERALVRMFLHLLQRICAKGNVFGAFDSVEMVGVCATTGPGQCQLQGIEKLRIFPAIFWGNSISTPMRVLRWVAEWSRYDPKEPHWHLGPFAVDFGLQGRGIGSAMLVDFCARMDHCGMLSYLETDKSENVRFYEKFGFTVIAEAEILGIPNWFMSRSPRITSS